MSTLPYSYHTFIFPFIWKTSKEIVRDDFEKILSVGRRWLDISWKSEKVREEVENQQVWFQEYAAFQYFTKSANNVIFNTRGDDVVRCFEYYKHKGEYVISKEGHDYRLVTNNIRLNVYDIGIAVLIFELENHEHKNLEDVNIINEFGRRINFPFLMSSGSHILCADKITVSFDDLSFTEDYFRTIQNTGESTDYIKEHIAMNYVMRPIQELLDGKGADNGGYKVTANEEHSNTNNFYIKPCVDDRMFVCCLVRDEEYSNKIKVFNRNEGEYKYLSECYDREEKGLDIDLYKLLYVEKDASCQSATMRHELLKRSIYDRWIDWGTIHGVTHHSLICLTGAYEGIINSVINPFLTQYVQIAVLTVVQRAVILLLSDEAAEVANGFAGEDEITQEEIKSIERLQARYVTAQNQLLLSEVTAQEQGVEIYEMLQEQLYIKKNMDDLHSEIGNLRDVADIANSRLERANDEESAKNEKKIENSITLLSSVIGALGIASPIASHINKLVQEEVIEYNFFKMLYDYDLTELLLSIFIGIFIFSVTKLIMKGKKKGKNNHDYDL